MVSALAVLQGIHTPPAQFLEQQIDSVLGAIGASVVKTGMLPDAKVSSSRHQCVPWLRASCAVRSAS